MIVPMGFSSPGTRGAWPFALAVAGLDERRDCKRKLATVRRRYCSERFADTMHPIASGVRDRNNERLSGLDHVASDAPRDPAQRGVCERL
jgi:hypothetical protein